MPPAISGATKLIETIVLQPTPFCNIDCSYCYLPQRNKKSVLSLNSIMTLFAKIFAGWAMPHVTVIWHAGEPLVLPVSYYQTAFEAIERLRPPAQHLRHSLQTNGMLITPAWCEFFKKYQVGIGVSIDGPQHLHDAHRRTRSGKGTFAQTLAGIRLLRAHQVPFHVISVLSQASLDAADEMLDFYLAEGIENICFNVEESEGEHVSDLFAASNVQNRYRRFLERFWTQARQTGRINFIREIDGMLPRIFRPEEVGVGNVQVEPFAMLNVDCHGNVSSFSPELLGYEHAGYNNFIIGNIHADTLDAMFHSAPMTAMRRDIAAGVEACRLACDYFSVCGGGAPVNKLAENGSFRTGRTKFCSLTQMAPTDIILSAFDRLAHRLEDAEHSLATSSARPKARMADNNTAQIAGLR